MKKVLIVDDDPQTCWLLSQILEKEGYEVIIALSGQEALEKLKKDRPDIVFLDVKMPDVDGMETLKLIKQENNAPIVIMITAFQSVGDAVSCMKLGAYDYLSKPFNNEEIKIIIGKALREKALIEEVNDLRTQLKRGWDFDNIVTTSPKMINIFDQIKKVAPTDIAVLLIGESGTGKELLARAIHYNSQRREGPFIPVDCASLPDTLVESELFGYEKGAFTGANRKKEGRFELAHQGTLFLDEIGNLEPSTQTKLLRAIEEKEIQTLGGKKSTRVDIRLVAATNIDLELAVMEGRFREDLYYRINQFKVILPSLRERESDILLLTRHFLREFNAKNGNGVKELSKEAIELLFRYPWPGNVRELKSAVQSAAVLADKIILPKHLPSNIKEFNENSQAYINLKLPLEKSLKEVKDLALQQTEKALIEHILKATNYNKAKSAKLLGVDYKTLYNKVKKYDINIGVQDRAEIPDVFMDLDLKAGESLKEASHKSVQRVEEALILKALKETNYNKAKSAKLLGVDYKTLYNKVRQYDIKMDAQEAEIPDKIMDLDLKVGEPLKEAAHKTMQRVEEALILKVLKETNYNKAKSAKLLGVDYKTLYNKVK